MALYSNEEAPTRDNPTSWGFSVAVSGGIEPPSQAPETCILSVVLRDRMRHICSGHKGSPFARIVQCFTACVNIRIFAGRLLYDTVRKLLGMLLAVAALTAKGTAQMDCSALVPYESGTEWVYQWYGADEKATFQSHRLVLPDGVDEMAVQLEIVDALGDTIYQGQYHTRCEEHGLYEGLIGKLTPDMLSSLNNLDLDTQEDGWLIPHGLAPGDTIAQSYSRISASQDGQELLELDLAIGPVNVLSQEDLTTPAGGFPCVVMAYELWVTSIVRKRFRLRDWWSPGIGVIRREVFDRHGRFFGYCELVGFAKK